MIEQACLAAAVEQSADGIVITDTSGKIQYVNPAFTAMTGYTAEEAIGLYPRVLKSGRQPAAFYEELWSTVRSGRVWLGEVINRRKDGTFYTEEMRITPVLASNGEIGSYIAIKRDVTERRAAEETQRLLEEALRAIRERHRMLAHALESAGECISITDTENRILYVNDAFRRIYGYSDDELIGQSITMLRSARTPMARQDEILPATMAGEWRGELWNRTKEGRDFPISLATSTVYDETGQTVALVGIASDITEWKQAEELSARYLSDLEGARDAQDRNATELARIAGQLALEKDRAEAATRAKSQFLSSMSHEIRTPMCGIIGMTGLLLDTPLTPEQRGYAEIVRSSGEGLLNIINDILDFSKIEAGKIDLEAVPFDLHSVLAGVVELFAAKAQEKKLKLLLRYDPDAMRQFLGDPGRIRQVGLNLIGNAIKFTEYGQVLVEVGSMARSGGLASIRIDVRDTGIGIPADRQGILFQRFQQVDSSTTRKYGGTGLGLAISKQFVELMGGTLSLVSQVGEGSTFSIEMPLRANPLPPAESRPERWKEPRALPSFAGRRILLVEDNSVNQNVGTALLGKLGCRVDVAPNGREALEMTAHVPYDLIFMDCQMPEMDGYEATGEIRRREGVARHTPIIALTAGAMAEDRARCVQAGMDDYLSKPFRLAQLDAMLDTYLGRVHSREQEQLIGAAPPKVDLGVVAAFPFYAHLTRVNTDGLQ